MRHTYIAALETRAQWLRYAVDEAKDELRLRHIPNYAAALKMYAHSLHSGDTLFMDTAFCELVDYARTTVPDDLVFEKSWMQTEAGFMLLESPFECPVPLLDDPGARDWLDSGPTPRIAAVSWMPVTDTKGSGTATMFMTYLRYSDMGSSAEGFACWTRFTVRNGEVLAGRIREYESTVKDLDSGGTNAGIYPKERATEQKHEIRWVYTAMHLMSQRLAMYIKEPTSSMARMYARRRRLEIAPFLRVVTLRRRSPDTQPNESSPVDWSCRWFVHHHWRNQWYPKEQIHRRVFIEDYVKGPDDKLFRAPAHTLFKATR